MIEVYEKICGRALNPHLLRKLRFFLTKDFEISLIVLEPACKILKSLKNRIFFFAACQKVLYN